MNRETIIKFLDLLKRRHHCRCLWQFYPAVAGYYLLTSYCSCKEEKRVLEYTQAEIETQLRSARIT